LVQHARANHTPSQAAKNCSGNGSIEPSASAFFLLTGCFL
jgi:hypothetical protein